MSRIKFILNDETKVNQYGFRVRNSGLHLSRFENNPVILDSHRTGTDAVIGRWEEIMIEGHQLTAVAVFDEEDPEAAKIAGKVKRGFLKACSLGLNPFSMSNFQLAPDDIYDLVESEVMEASIVSIPNNANALSVTLYASGKDKLRELQENEVREILLMASDANQFNFNSSMKKITLNLSAVAALGLPGNTLEHDESVVNEKIINLKAELDAANTKLKGFEQLEADKKAKLSAETVDADIKAGKFDATKREEFIKLHAEFPELYKTTVSAIPEKVSLSAQVSNPATPNTVKTFDEFQKLDLSAQLDFKNNFPEEYNKLFAQ